MDEPKLFNSDQYVRILYSDGVRTVFYENRFELLVKPDCDVIRNQALEAFKQWLDWREQNVRESRDLSK